MGAPITTLNPHKYIRQFADAPYEGMKGTTDERNAYLSNETRFAGQLWADTDLDNTFQLNGARDTWISIGGGAFALGLGSTTKSVTFTGAAGLGAVGTVTFPEIDVPLGAFISEAYVVVNVGGLTAVDGSAYITIGIETDAPTAVLDPTIGLVTTLNLGPGVTQILNPDLTRATTNRTIAVTVGGSNITAGTLKLIVIISDKMTTPAAPGVETVTGLNTDNTDPLNPIVQLSVDNTTITGSGTPGDPLVGAGGGGAPNLIIYINTATPTGVLANKAAFEAALVSDNASVSVKSFDIAISSLGYIINISVINIIKIPDALFQGNTEIIGLIDFCSILEIGINSFESSTLFFFRSLSVLVIDSAAFANTAALQTVQLFTYLGVGDPGDIFNGCNSSFNDLTVLKESSSTTAVQTANSFVANILANVKTVPGGFNPQLQYNNSGVFAGSADGIFDNTDGVSRFGFGYGAFNSCTPGAKVVIRGFNSADRGPELVTNGDFSGGTTGWTFGTNWSLVGTLATHASGGSGEILSQTVPLIPCATYEIMWDQTGPNSITMILGSNAITHPGSGSGLSVIFQMANSVGPSSLLSFLPNPGTFAGTITNVSVKQVLLNALNVSGRTYLKDFVGGGVQAIGVDDFGLITSADLAATTAVGHVTPTDIEANDGTRNKVALNIIGQFGAVKLFSGDNSPGNRGGVIQITPGDDSSTSPYTARISCVPGYSASRTFTLPNNSGALPLSVNGNTADASTGDISVKIAHVIFIPTTGATINSLNNQTNIIAPTGALVALTINVPSSPADGDVIYLKFTKAVTTVTYANGTVVGGIISPVLGSYFSLTYDIATTTWY